MRIGFSTFTLGTGQSGVSTYIRELLLALQLEDVENTYDLLMSSDHAGEISLTNPNFRNSTTPLAVAHPLINLLWHNTILAGRGKQYDVLHIPTARRIPLLKKTKVVATVHDLAAFSLKNKYGPARTVFNRNLVPSMIRNADHVIAVSHSTKTDLVCYAGYPEERISVIYSGINHGLFQPVSPDEARSQLRTAHGLNNPFFVYVSRLEYPAKNHIRLIEAFERFKLENDSAHELVLAGADWHGAEVIRKRAAESPVKDSIRLLGFVPMDSLPLLYSGCDLMIFPSLFEGFGFPIVEALACGAPVLCSNTSSMLEIAGDLIPTFDPTHSEEIFRHMEAAVSTGQSADMRRRGMDYARRFDWRKTACDVMKVYGALF